jgi:hypothetical protein
MDPLVSLHYFAPVCSIINACFIPFTEGWAPFLEIPRLGLFVMVTNAAVAFGLNVAAVFLIGAAGGLVLTLAGVFKVSSNLCRARLQGGGQADGQDILLISSSCLFFGSKITPIQVFGELALAVSMCAQADASRLLARPRRSLRVQDRVQVIRCLGKALCANFSAPEIATTLAEPRGQLIDYLLHV